VSVTTPRFTIQKPQTHHKKTIRKMQVFAKPPEKKTLFPAQQKSYNNERHQPAQPLVKSKQKAQSYLYI
jgi:hypothetical protein